MASQIFTENISESMDKQLYVLGLLFDLTKAYDTINNEILLNKLEYCGIRGTLKAWIKSYFLYWPQFVEIFKTDNIRRNQKIYEPSLFKEIKHRVPQGYVLGPLFVFIIYKWFTFIYPECKIGPLCWLYQHTYYRQKYWCCTGNAK